MDRDAAIRFEPEGHSYTVHGEKYTSVTTFKATLFSKFDADAVVARMMASPSWPTNKYYGQTAEEIKEGWAEAGRVACTEGTRMHKSIEDFYNGHEVADDSPEYQQFLAFAPTVKGKPYRAEWTVYHEEFKLAGTIDMVFVLPDGTLEVYDWKRTKGLVKKGYSNALHPAIAHLPDTNFWQYAVQLNLYRYILEAKYDKKVSGMFLACFHPTQPAYQVEPVPELDLSGLFFLNR